MIKKLVFVLVAFFAFYACSDDDKTQLPAPEVTDVVIEGSSSEENPLQIELGESLSFSLDLKEQMDVAYSWILKDQEVSTAEKFTFTPEETGEYKLAVKMTNADGISSVKEIGVITVVHAIPVINNLLCDGEVVSGAIKVTATSELVFKVDAEKTDKATFYWIMNGDTIPNAKEATLDFKLGLSGTLSVAIVNPDDISTTQEAELVGPYKNGTFVFGTSYTGLCFIGEDGVQENDNVYETINKGEKLGDNGVNDLQIYKNKVYFLIPSLSYSDKRAQIVVADAQTLKKIDVITATGFSSSDLGTIYNLAIINNDKAYIGSNLISAGNTSSVKVLDLKERVMADGVIEGTSGKMGTDGPGWARMLTLDKQTLVACGGKIQVINHETDKVEKTIDFKSGQVIDVIKGKDKKVYALVNAEKNSDPGFVATLNTETFAIESEEKMIYNETNISFNGGGMGMTNSRVAVSPVTDEIFFSVAGASAWSPSSEIYKYNYTSKKMDLFADAKKDSRASAINGYMGVDSQGILLVPLSGAYSYQNEDIVAYDIKTGDKIANHKRLKQGEGSAYPTWLSR